MSHEHFCPNCNAYWLCKSDDCTPGSMQFCPKCEVPRDHNGEEIDNDEEGKICTN